MEPPFIYKYVKRTWKHVLPAGRHWQVSDSCLKIHTQTCDILWPVIIFSMQSICVVTCWNHATWNTNTQGRTIQSFNSIFTLKTDMSYVNNIMILSHDKSSVLSFRRDYGNWKDFLVFLHWSFLLASDFPYIICLLKRRKHIYHLLGSQPEMHVVNVCIYNYEHMLSTGQLLLFHLLISLDGRHCWKGSEHRGVQGISRFTSYNTAIEHQYGWAICDQLV